MGVPGFEEPAAKVRKLPTVPSFFSSSPSGTLKGVSKGNNRGSDDERRRKAGLPAQIRFAGLGTAAGGPATSSDARGSAMKLTPTERQPDCITSAAGADGHVGDVVGNRACNPSSSDPRSVAATPDPSPPPITSPQVGQAAVAAVDGVAAPTADVVENVAVKGAEQLASGAKAKSGAPHPPSAPEPIQEAPSKEGGKPPLWGAGNVYGFEEGKRVECKGKAIVLRLEPLGPAVPEFERVLGQDRQNVSIGSQRGVMDIVVRDEVVSKKHVTLEIVGIHRELALSIVDWSTNGTYVNGERLPVKKKRYHLHSGDKLLLKHPGLDQDFGWKVDIGNTVAFFTRA